MSASLRGLVREQHSSVEDVHHQVYTHIQRQCWHWIATHIRQGAVQCTYEVPVVLPHYPLYSVRYVSERLIEDLRSEGMKVWLDGTGDDTPVGNAAWVLIVNWSDTLAFERNRTHRAKQVQHDLDSHHDLFAALAAEPGPAPVARASRRRA